MTLAKQIEAKSAEEIRLMSISMIGKLDSGDLLTGTPSVVSISPTIQDDDIAVDGIARNDAAMTIDGEDVIAAQAIQLMVSGGTPGQLYVVRVSCTTSAGQLVDADMQLRVTA